MNCKHTHGRTWSTKKGYTKKCRSCGMIRHFGLTAVPTSGFRQFVPGLQTMHPDGTVTVETIDVICHGSYYAPSSEWHHFRR